MQLLLPYDPPLLVLIKLSELRFSHVIFNNIAEVVKTRRQRCEESLRELLNAAGSLWSTDWDCPANVSTDF